MDFKAGHNEQFLLAYTSEYVFPPFFAHLKRVQEKNVRAGMSDSEKILS